MNDTKNLGLIGGLVGALIAIAAVFFLPAAEVILGLCACALIASVMLFWNSIRTLGGDTNIPDEAPQNADRGPLEAKIERKQMLLLSLKDLEAERKLGKILEQDYEDLVYRYRTEIKVLMKEMDETAAPYRKKAEDIARAHLAAKGFSDGAPVPKVEESASDVSEAITKSAPAIPKASTAPTTPSAEDSDADVAADSSEVATTKLKEPIPTVAKSAAAPAKIEEPIARATCVKCGESNEPDAKFCKSCATPMKSAEGSADA